MDMSTNAFNMSCGEGCPGYDTDTKFTSGGELVDTQVSARKSSYGPESRLAIVGIKDTGYIGPELVGA